MYLADRVSDLGSRDAERIERRHPRFPRRSMSLDVARCIADSSRDAPAQTPRRRVYAAGPLTGYAARRGRSFISLCVRPALSRRRHEKSTRLLSARVAATFILVSSPARPGEGGFHRACHATRSLLVLLENSASVN